MSTQVQFRVPPATLETHFWKPSFPDHYSRAEVQRQTGQYQSVVPARLVDAKFSFDLEISTEMEEATLRLQEFDLYSLARFGKESVVLGPMSSILLRTESASSSQIEQLTTTAKQLALAELGQSSKANAHTVVGNVRAMEAALALADNLDLSSIRAMHRELLIGHPSLSSYAGFYREELVWVGGRDNAGPRQAEFIGPQPELIDEAMNDLVGFMNRTDLPIIAQIAIAHAQFETIHPFVDGNGRTGRALAQMMLHNKGLTTHTTVPISAGILTNTRRYFDSLTQFRQGDAGAVVQIFCDAARFASGTGKDLINALNGQLEQARTQLMGIRSDAAAWKVLPLLIAQPIVNAKYLKNRLGLNDSAATRTIDTLVSRGIVMESTGHSRNRVWVHQGILQVLDEYAAGISRRRHQ